MIVYNAFSLMISVQELASNLSNFQTHENPFELDIDARLNQSIIQFALLETKFVRKTYALGQTSIKLAKVVGIVIWGYSARMKFAMSKLERANHAEAKMYAETIRCVFSQIPLKHQSEFVFDIYLLTHHQDK